MTVLAVVPARSGSKSIPDKNIQTIGGIPLLAYPIIAAKHSASVGRIVCSTDSPEYAKIAEVYGAEVPFMRPPELAEDVPSEEVLVHAVENLHVKDDDVVVMLQCTTPFVTPQNIDDCTVEVSSRGHDAAVTVCECSEHPEWAFRLEQGRLMPRTLRQMKGEWGVRQSLGKFYRPNGAVYAVKNSYLLKHHQIFSPHDTIGVLMPKIRSVDIDDEDDLKIARAIAFLVDK